MRATTIGALVALLALAVTSEGGAQAQERKEPRKPEGQQQEPRDTPRRDQPEAGPAPKVAVPVYKPPLRGAPGGRVGGGTRGVGREVFVLSVLAPDHMGLTGSEHPTLYWFISSPSSFPVELTLADPRATEPVLETRLAPPVRRGLHRIRLADHGVRLEPGVAYRWFVAVVPDASRRSRDVLAGAAIERVAMPPGLVAKVAQADARNHPFLYADAGLWYDAIHAISQLIEAAPEDAALRQQRSALMRQVGLPEIGE